MNKDFKIYEQIDRLDVQREFSISRMETIYEKRAGKADEPHRHSYFTIVFTKKASGKHEIDFKSFELKARQIYFISPGQVHQIIETSRSEGYAITFSHTFLQRNHISLPFIHALQLFMALPRHPPIEGMDDSKMQDLEHLCARMCHYYEQDSPFKIRALGALLEVFLIDCYNLCSLPTGLKKINQRRYNLYQDFMLLLEKKYREWHQPQSYASELFVSPDHLNRVLKKFSGQTTKQLIKNRIMTEAKRQLFFTGASAKEIGYSLGFTEPANFSNFFKNELNMTPGAFRASNHQ